MIKMKFTYIDNISKLQERVDKANTKTLRMIGGFTWKKARDLTRTNPKQVRAPGQPWRRGSGQLRNAMAFNVQEAIDNVEIGFRKFVYTSELHEFGGIGTVKNKKGRGKRYPARPVMGPAFEKTKANLRVKFPEIYRKYFE